MKVTKVSIGRDSLVKENKQIIAHAREKLNSFERPLVVDSSLSVAN